MAGLVTLTVLEQPNVASAAEIKVLCSNGIKAVMQELIVAGLVVGTFFVAIMGPGIQF